MLKIKLEHGLYLKWEWNESFGFSHFRFVAAFVSDCMLDAVQAWCEKLPFWSLSAIDCSAIDFYWERVLFCAFSWSRNIKLLYVCVCVKSFNVLCCNVAMETSVCPSSLHHDWDLKGKNGLFFEGSVNMSWS